MGEAIEISVWEPHPGKFEEFLETYKGLKRVFLEVGVSQVQIITGVAGKDMGHVMVIQTFKGLGDNGAINESIGESEAMKAYRAEDRGMFPAKLISHDLYEVLDD